MGQAKACQTIKDAMHPAMGHSVPIPLAFVKWSRTEGIAGVGKRKSKRADSLRCPPILH